MSNWEHFMLWVAHVASFTAAVWVGALLFHGVTVADCKYLVPVAHHPGVLSCSMHPGPIREGKP